MTKTFQMYLTVDHVYDGDTIVGELDQGLGHYTRPIRLRLARINAAEIAGPKSDRAVGLPQRDHLAAIVTAGDVLKVLSVKWDNYSQRIDGEAWTADDTNLSDYQLAFGVPPYVE